jgi:hypothetical protein
VPPPLMAACPGDKWPPPLMVDGDGRHKAITSINSPLIEADALCLPSPLILYRGGRR